MTTSWPSRGLQRANNRFQIPVGVYIQLSPVLTQVAKRGTWLYAAEEGGCWVEGGGGRRTWEL